MTRHIRLFAAIVLCATGMCVGTVPAVANDAELPGQWYGTGKSLIWSGETNRISVLMFEYAPDLYAGETTVPSLDLFDTLLPVELDGSTVTIGDPDYLAFVGVLADDVISGVTVIPSAIPPYYDVLEWQLFKDTGEEPQPGEYPGAVCGVLPDLFCAGSAEHSGELVPFEPILGAGYFNYAVNGETFEDQYRSYLRRDLRTLIDYATAKVACMAAEWDYGNFAPLCLGDMSEADGSIPGTSIGFPGHPWGTHTDGLDIDLAYYQLFSVDNWLRPIGEHRDENYVDQYHLVEPPHALDVWRTALLIAYISEHPRARLIAVDGQAGPMVEDALDELMAMGYIDAELRASIPLGYEVEDGGQLLYRFHHHHLHVSLSPLSDILASVELAPGTLNRKSKGKVVTAYLELAAEHDVKDVIANDVALMLDGHTLLYALPGRSSVGDQDRDGIPDLMVQFDRQQLLSSLAAGAAEVTLIGQVDGLFFQGTDTVRVIHRK